MPFLSLVKFAGLFSAIDFCLQDSNTNLQPESIFSHCRFNLLGDANSKAQPAQIERCNKGMADSLYYGLLSPRGRSSTCYSLYCSLGGHWPHPPTFRFCHHRTFRRCLSRSYQRQCPYEEQTILADRRNSFPSDAMFPVPIAEQMCQPHSTKPKNQP